MIRNDSLYYFCFKFYHFGLQSKLDPTVACKKVQSIYSLPGPAHTSLRKLWPIKLTPQNLSKKNNTSIGPAKHSQPKAYIQLYKATVEGKRRAGKGKEWRTPRRRRDRLRRLSLVQGYGGAATHRQTADLTNLGHHAQPVGEHKRAAGHGSPRRPVDGSWCSAAGDCLAGQRASRFRPGQKAGGDGNGSGQGTAGEPEEG
jgi:hypothetical protein